MEIQAEKHIRGDDSREVSFIKKRRVASHTSFFNRKLPEDVPWRIRRCNNDYGELDDSLHPIVAN